MSENSRRAKSNIGSSNSSNEETNSSDNEEEEFVEDVPEDLRQYITKEVWNSYSPARQNSFKSMFRNPNCFFLRNRPPGELQKMGPFSEEEQELFLQRLKYFRNELHIYDKLWGLFAVPFTGRFGYQIVNFYRRLLRDGVVKKVAKSSNIDPEVEKMLNDQAIEYLKDGLAKKQRITEPQYRPSKQMPKSDSCDSDSDDFGSQQRNAAKGKQAKSKTITKNLISEDDKTILGSDSEIKRTKGSLLTQSNSRNYKSQTIPTKAKRRQIKNSESSDEESDSETESRIKRKSKAASYSESDNESDYEEKSSVRINKRKTLKSISSDDDHPPQKKSQITSKIKLNVISKPSANTSNHQQNTKQANENERKSKFDDEYAQRNQNIQNKRVRKPVDTSESESESDENPKIQVQNKRIKKPVYKSESGNDNESQKKPQSQVQNKRVRKPVYKSESESESDDKEKPVIPKKRKRVYKSDSESESDDTSKLITRNKRKRNNEIMKKPIVQENKKNVKNSKPFKANEISEIFYAPDPITNNPMEHPLLDSLAGVVMDESTWLDYFQQKFVSPYFICAHNFQELLPVTPVVLDEYRNQIINIHI